MNSNNTKSDLSLPTTLFKEILSKLDFAQTFMNEPEIFNLHSAASRKFLIQAFAYIHPDFHYLSFLNKEIDQEILRAAEILQILPFNTKSDDKLLVNLSDSEIKKFWMRIFALLDGKKEISFSFDTLRTSQEEKFEFFKDISKTLDYVHQEFVVIKEKNINSETLNNEIEKWTNVDIKCPCPDEYSSFLNFNAQPVEHINIEKLLTDLHQVTSVLQNTQFSSNVNKLEHVEFFNNFTCLAKNIDEYMVNLKEINSSFLDEFHNKMMSDVKSVPLSSVYFLKRCCNFFKTLQCQK